jgi:hypothetical protein
VATFLTLDQAKRRLRLPTTSDDVDLQALVDQAEAQVVQWCSTSARAKALVDSWDAGTVPLVVVAAILIQTAEMDRFRGDDPQGPPRQAGEELATPVRELLRAYHDPVSA